MIPYSKLISLKCRGFESCHDLWGRNLCTVVPQLLGAPRKALQHKVLFLVAILHSILGSRSTPKQHTSEIDSCSHWNIIPAWSCISLILQYANTL